MASLKPCSPSCFAQTHAALTQEQSDQDLSLAQLENAFTDYNSQLQQTSKEQGHKWRCRATIISASFTMVTEDEAKTCSVFVWVCREETAAPSDNHGQEKLGGTIAQIDFHLCHLHSKKKIGLFTVSATQLHPAFLLDKYCFGKPVSKATPQKQKLQKRSCTAKSLVSKWEHLTTPHRGKISLFFLPAPFGA